MSTSTPSRREAREQARAERQRKEQEAALHAQRKRRLIWIGGGLIALIALVAIVVAVSSGGGSSSSSTPASSSSGAAGLQNVAGVSSEFAGIPQKGNVLGASNAPATMMVFADMQCPFCADFETKALPSIVQRYVKNGKLKVVFQPISIIGNDSVTASRAVAAAALQNKGFDYASLLYFNQGEENTGYVTDKYLTNLAHGVAGLNVAKWKADLKSPAANSILARAQSASQTARVDSTPTFLVAKSGQPLSQFQVTSLTPQAFYGKLDSLTG